MNDPTLPADPRSAAILGALILLCALAGIAALALRGSGVAARLRPRAGRRVPLRYTLPWLRQYYWLVLILLGVTLGTLALIFYLAEAALIVRALIDRLRVLSSAPGDNSEAIRNIGQATALLLGALAAAATLIFQLVKVWVTERQTLTAEQGHITDRINAALRNLGEDKVVNRLGRTVRYTINGTDHSSFEWQGEERPLPDHDIQDGERMLTNDPWSSFPQTQPNLEVRVGAIHALARIAEDSPRDHIQIMEILCAYIRQNAPAPGEQDNPHHVFWALVEPEDGSAAVPEEAAWNHPSFQKLRPYGDSPKDMTVENMVALWVRKLPPPRVDIQTALTVIGRRSTAQRALEQDPTGTATYRLDLRGSNLRRADLAGLELSWASLFEAHLEGADLFGAHLEGARPIEAHLEGARLIEAHLEGARLLGAHSEGASLFEAHLEGARLLGAHLEGADLFGPDLEGADLEAAHLEGADLDGAQFDDRTSLNPATLRGAGLRDVDITHIGNETFTEAFGDATVKLPARFKAGEAPLSHWPAENLDWQEFEQAWRRWQAEHHPDLLPDGYTPQD
ncbi:Pentapeptide repeat-containing protein [Palleronia salina]|uniref:Pentapeptide repeat-containing protein n=1 Tax=Palleronia salina TaxID=313368 RepID=A0A1M6BFC9_9RHOB|nr:pentapeptide repeat-containing protein [Palleronia salina]SHI47450.1 Pentapeptide repeat-containing protein [Palleronia salina]